MDGEGDGPTGPFFPSSAQVYGGEKNSQQVLHGIGFLQALSRGYLQPVETVRLTIFPSFNNQWYRKSIEYMQDTIGTKPSKWCGGCHDPAVLYAGKMDTPINKSCTRPKPKPDSAA